MQAPSRQLLPTPHGLPFGAGAPSPQTCALLQSSRPSHGSRLSHSALPSSPVMQVKVQSFSQPSAGERLPSSQSSRLSSLPLPQLLGLGPASPVSPLLPPSPPSEFPEEHPAPTPEAAPSSTPQTIKRLSAECRLLIITLNYNSRRAPAARRTRVALRSTTAHNAPR
jgi:hypothetical protein